MSSADMPVRDVVVASPLVVPPSEDREKPVVGRPPVVLGMSLGNPFYYKDENLTRFIQYADNHADQVKLFITDIISEHNYRAVGAPNPERTARIKANRLRNKCKSAAKNLAGLDPSKMSYVDWKKEVETSEHYTKQLVHIMDLFYSHQQFHSEVREVTDAALRCLLNGRNSSMKENRPELMKDGGSLKVIGRGDGKVFNDETDNTGKGQKVERGSVMGEATNQNMHSSHNSPAVNASCDVTDDYDVMEGVNYLLKELAFFLALPQIYTGFEKFVFVYHRPWPILENLFNGVYDGCDRTCLDFVILKGAEKMNS